MAYWNPDFTDPDEILAAHRRGSGVAIVLAVLLLLQAAAIYVLESMFAPTGLVEPSIWSVADTLGVAVFALIVAWRFSVGKGAFSGALLVSVLALEIVLAAIDGEFAGIVVAAIIVVGLLHAVRAAFAVRSSPVMAERFE